MKSYFLFIFIVLFSVSFSKPTLYLGAKAGLNFSTTKNAYLDSLYQKKYHIGSNFGGVIQLEINKFFAVETNINFEQKGYKSFYKLDSAKYISKNTHNYLIVPIVGVVKFGSNKIKATAEIGTYLAYFSGKYNQKTTIVNKISVQNTNQELPFINNSNYKDNRLDVGLIAGIGTQISIKEGAFLIGGKYNIGLINLVKPKNNFSTPKIKNNTINIYIGYIHPINFTKNKQ